MALNAMSYHNSIGHQRIFLTLQLKYHRNAYNKQHRNYHNLIGHQRNFSYIIAQISQKCI